MINDFINKIFLYIIIRMSIIQQFLLNREPEKHPPKPRFFPIFPSPSLSNPTFASRRPLLAVIFRCENTPDSQTGFEPEISHNNSAVLSRISAILGVGTPSQEDSLRRRSGAGKRVGSLPVLRGIPDPQNSPFFPSPHTPAHLNGDLPTGSSRFKCYI